ncbi:MAG: metal-sensitive transcriptional regulator [Candidatus Omnitrophota bacterium]
MSKAKYPDHTKNLIALKRIEGQIRGIQKMVLDRKYCVDILTQVHAVIGALARVEDSILSLHLEGCVTKAIKGKSFKMKQEKIAEVLGLMGKFRKV